MNIRVHFFHSLPFLWLPIVELWSILDSGHTWPFIVRVLLFVLAPLLGPLLSSIDVLRVQLPLFLTEGALLHCVEPRRLLIMRGRRAGVLARHGLEAALVCGVLPAVAPALDRYGNLVVRLSGLVFSSFHFKTVK